MSVNLSPETERRILEYMRRGGYSDPEQVIRAGLESLELQENAADFAPGELDQLLEEAERGGPSITGDSVFEELRQLRSNRGEAK